MVKSNERPENTEQQENNTTQETDAQRDGFRYDYDDASDVNK